MSQSTIFTWVLSFSHNGHPCHLIAFAATEEEARQSLLESVKKDNEFEKENPITACNERWTIRPMTQLAGPYAPTLHWCAMKIDGDLTLEKAIMTAPLDKRPLSAIFVSALDG